MSEILAEKVQLHVIPTEKYKTIQVVIRFATNMNKRKSSLRTLLSSLLETNSLNYPKRTDISKKLSELYGASFGVGTMRKGNLHCFDVSLTIVNPKFLPNKTELLELAFDFLNEVIYFPNVQNNQFDEATFSREKENLQSYIESVYDDKQSMAALELQELYFLDSDDQKAPSFGTVADVETITNEELLNYYNEMIQEDEIDIIVLGDVNPAEITKQMAVFDWGKRKPQAIETMYHQTALPEVRTKEDQLPVQQAKLNLAYQTNYYFHDKDYFPLQIFNGLFGGFPHSKLFANVREKESLAYYASSSLDTFRGLMTVQTGIEGKEKERVLKLISEQLSAIIQGDVSDEAILQTKAMIRNQYLLSQDNPNAVVESYYLKKKVPQSDLSSEEWLGKLDTVTVEDIQSVAKNIQLQAIYFMEGNE